MNGHEVSFIKERPQSLCKMCGRCCRVLTGSYPYDEILRMAQEDNEYAKDFIKLFEPYESIEAARAVDKDTVDNIIKRLEADEKFDKNSLTFYHCRYILDNNMCAIYEERPTLCRLCPSSGWVVTPPGCGFESWLFLKREEDMERVRKYKEELLELEIIKKKNHDEKILQKIDSVEKKLHATIELFSAHGSKDW